jgi:anti-sigma factor RsiW
MNCRELDQLLPPYLDGEFDDLEEKDVVAHLTYCGNCAQKIEREQRLREKMRDTLQRASGQVSSPDALRQRVQAGFRRERQRDRRLVWAKAGMVAVVVAGSSAVYLRMQFFSQKGYVDDAAMWHAKGLPYEIQKETHEQLEAWFGGKLDHRVSVPRLKNATLTGARLSNVKDRPAAYISYEAAVPSSPRPRRVGLFVFSDSDGRLSADSLPRVEVATSHGYNVAVWREGEIVYELVSDLDEQHIRQMLQERNGTELRPRLPASIAPNFSIQPAALQK